jgi:hypothetical protein
MTPQEYADKLRWAEQILSRPAKPKKRRGFPPDASRKGADAAAKAHKEDADEHYRPLYALLLELRAKGLSLAAIAAELNARGERTGIFARPWNPTQVGRVLRRAERLQAESEAAADVQ